MTPDFIARIVGLVIFTIVGARLGADVADGLALSTESSSFIVALVGALVGLVITPYLTTRPARFLRHMLTDMPIERLILSIVGMVVGGLVGLLLAYPLSLLPQPIGGILPPLAALSAIQLGMSIFATRSREIFDVLGQRFSAVRPRQSASSNRKIVLDTSVLIDARVADIAETGFLGGTLIVPRFVMGELHRIADSSDQLRRARGRRGLATLTKMQRTSEIAIRIVEDDFEDIAEVDNKLVALAVQLAAALMTNDYNLGQVADAQGVTVLNINELANRVKASFLPGERFAIRIIQEGRDTNQGVGYLDDGTMVVVENGRNYMDRTIMVEVTKSIQRDTGRMIFATPEADIKRLPSRPDAESIEG